MTVIEHFTFPLKQPQGVQGQSYKCLTTKDKSKNNQKPLSSFRKKNLFHAMATSTDLDFGCGGCFCTRRVKTPFSHLAVIAETLALSGNLNFLSRFCGALLSSRRYLQPSSSPSCRFLFPLLLITSVFSSSTVTCNAYCIHIL